MLAALVWGHCPPLPVLAQELLHPLLQSLVFPCPPLHEGGKVHTMQGSHCPASTAAVPVQPKPCAAVPRALESAMLLFHTAPSIRFSSIPCTKPQGSLCNVLPPPRLQCPNLPSQPPHPPRVSQPRRSGSALPRAPRWLMPCPAVPSFVPHGSRFAPRPIYPRSTCSRHHRPASAFPRERRRARSRGEAWPHGGRIQSARGGDGQPKRGVVIY